MISFVYLRALRGYRVSFSNTATYTDYFTVLSTRQPYLDECPSCSADPCRQSAPFPIEYPFAHMHPIIPLLSNTLRIWSVLPSGL